MYEKYHEPINIKKGKSEITLAFGIGSFNPDDSKEKGLFEGRFKFDRNPWLKFKGGCWHYIKEKWRFSHLEDIADFIKRDAYSEEQFLEHIFELI